MLPRQQPPQLDGLSYTDTLDWRSADREQEYAKLLNACWHPAKVTLTQVELPGDLLGKEMHQLDHAGATVYAYAFSPDGKRALTGAADNRVRVWDIEAVRLDPGLTPLWPEQVSSSGHWTIAGCQNGECQASRNSGSRCITAALMTHRGQRPLI